MLLARRPNVLVIDEFTAHLDPSTARIVASRLAKLARRTGMTLILVTHREEVIEAMNPDKVVVVGYGRVVVARGQGAS
ncbi:Methionine import ATP-binding protein MetN [compost metagenome]